MPLAASTQNTPGGLIPLTQADDGTQAVMGRDLHTFLESKEQYTDWINRHIEKYGFSAGQDYLEKSMNMPPAANGRVYTKADHILTLGMAIRVSGYVRTYNGERAVAYLTEGEILPRKEIRTPESSVYFIYAPAVKMVKIGRSTNIKSRIRALKTMSPTDLHLLATEGGGAERELALHNMFAEHRSHGEWFHMVPEIEDHIEHVATRKAPAHV